MSDSAPLGNLPIYNARTWTTGESMTRTKFQSEFDQAEALLTLCKLALADIQNRRHGTSSPTENAIAGQIWAKKISAARTQWFGDPDGAGADDQFLTEGEAYNADNKTAGTGTFKVGGAIDVDTTDNTVSDSGGTLHSYSVPASTLEADGDIVSFTAWGTDATTVSIGTVDFTYGGNALGIGLATLTGPFIARLIVVRTASGTAKWVFTGTAAKDTAGIPESAKSGTVSAAHSAAQIATLECAFSQVGDSFTGEAMIAKVR